MKDQDEILKKDTPNPEYDKALEKARQEGRIGGAFKCPVCGMSYKFKKKARDCCKGIKRAPTKNKKRRSRFFSR